MRHLLFFALSACAGPVDAAEEPSGAAIVTEDLPRFWAALDAPGDLVDNLDTLYLDPATHGLDGLRRARFRSADPLADAYTRHQAWYDAIRETAVGLHGDDALPRDILEAMEAAEADWPPAVHPDVTLAIGDFGTGGTVTREGILIGAELFSSHEGAPVDGLDSWHRAVVRGPEVLPHLVAHEHGHIQQLQFCGTARNTLLEQALVEGGADWLAERWSGAHLNAHVHEWALPREAELWAGFREDQDGRSYRRWMYEGPRDDDQPADVGYFVGYRIVEAWWAAHGAAPDAIERVLGASCDAEAFLSESGYQQP